jgi:hypothetical protein
MSISISESGEYLEIIRPHLDNLKDLLKKNDIGMLGDDEICLNDIVKKIIKPQHPNKYIKNVIDKRKVHDKYYISRSVCLDMLRQKNGDWEKLDKSKVVNQFINFFKGGNIKYIENYDMYSIRGLKRTADLYLPKYSITLEVIDNEKKDKTLNESYKCLGLRYDLRKTKKTVCEVIGIIHKMIMECEYQNLCGDYKLSFNYGQEIERDIKKMGYKKEIKLKKLELDILREKNKCDK